MKKPLLRLDLRFVNAYLIQAGDDYILIDTGIAEVWSQLEGELLRIGCLPDHLKIVVLTHGDKDHAGSARNLHEKYGVKIAMHVGDLEMVKTGRSPRRRGTNLGGKFSVWFDSKMSSEFHTFEPDVFLSDGQSLDSYGLSATILHTPGHTRGSICVLTGEGELIVGDTFTNRKKPAIANIIENEADLKKSLLKISALQVRAVYPGHGKPFKFEDLPKITGK